MKPRDTQSISANILGSWKPVCFSACPFLYVGFKTVQYIYITYLCYIHMYMPHWKQGAVSLKAVSRQLIYCILLFVNKHI